MRSTVTWLCSPNGDVVGQRFVLDPYECPRRNVSPASFFCPVRLERKQTDCSTSADFFLRIEYVGSSSRRSSSPCFYERGCGLCAHPDFASVTAVLFSSCLPIRSDPFAKNRSSTPVPRATTHPSAARNGRQTKVLEDMLRFEKQRGEAEEAASKAQKRLLVNEVKKLRTANLALKAECDDLRQQLKDLRTSVSQLGR